MPTFKSFLKVLLLLLFGAGLILGGLIFQFIHSLPHELARAPRGSEPESFAELPLTAPLAFPKGFLWGSATAAHQVEGGNTNNDWYLWETQRDKEGRCHIKNCEQSGSADEHYTRYDSDFDLAQQTGHSIYRFSMEWSRIEPREGQFDFNEVKHYKDVLASLRQRGIQPMVTLHHFTNPIWVAESGGWRNPDIVGKFERYVRFVAENFKSDVDWWVTINEPAVYAVNSYLYGQWPPGERNLVAALVVLTNMLKAHAKAYRAIHQIDNVDVDGDGRPAQVGIAKHLRVFAPYDPWSFLDKTVVRIQHAFFNRLFLDSAMTGRIKIQIPLVQLVDEYVPELHDSLDFIGVNYYSRDILRFDRHLPGALFGRVIYDPARFKYSEMGEGWEIHPQGLYDLLIDLKRLQKPIFITENGVSDGQGKLRPAFIAEHVYQVWRAIAVGVDVRGYICWSLLDNFEWAEGFTPRFGLYHVDYTTQERTLTLGGEVFKEIAQNNALTPAIQQLIYAETMANGTIH
jgi:beta-glucosidase